MTQKTEITHQNSPSHTKNIDHSKTWHKSLLALIFLLGLSVISLFFYINNLIKLQNMQFHQNIQNLNTEQTQTSISTLKKITEATQHFDNQYIKLNNKISKTLKETAYISNDWIMQKAKYYLELATINNNWTNDANTTKKLLTAADNTLRNIQKDEITEVRKIIAEENLQISAIKKIDTIKLLAEINAIDKYLKTLPIIPLKNKLTNNETSKTVELNQDNNWQNNLKNNLKKLNDLIIIRHNTQDSTQFLSPSYLLTIRETLRLNLQQMQWAILENNQEIYNLSCKQAIANINYALDKENSQKQAIIKKLHVLQKTNINLRKVKIGKSLTELNRIIKSTGSTTIKEEQHAD